MSPENSDLIDKLAETVQGGQGLPWWARKNPIGVETIMNAVRADERARADTVTPAMIQAAQDRVQGRDEDMYSAIYRAMRGAAYLTDSQLLAKSASNPTDNEEGA